MKRGGAGPRNKGSRFELDIAKQISERCGIAYGRDIRRTPNSGALITRSDLWVNPRERVKWPFFMEMKRRETTSLDNCLNPGWQPREWFFEAIEKLKVDPDYDPNSPVLLIMSRNRIDSMAMLMLSDLKAQLPDSHLSAPFRMIFAVKPKLVVVPWLWLLENVAAKGVNPRA